MLVAESLEVFTGLCKEVEEAHWAQADKLDTRLLRKITTQTQIMWELTKETSNRLLELDREAREK